jgi:hypothetical protein
MGVKGWGAAKDVKGKGLGRGSFEGLKVGRFEGWEVREHTPWFFVSIASTGLRFSVSLLFAALARWSVSVASGRFTNAGCWQKGNWERADGFEGVRRTARGEGMWAGRQGSVPEQPSHYSRSVPIVK